MLRDATSWRANCRERERETLIHIRLLGLELVIRGESHLRMGKRERDRQIQLDCTEKINKASQLRCAVLPYRGCALNIT